MKAASDIVVIGKLSVVKIGLFWLFFAAIFALAAAGGIEDIEPRVALALFVFALIWLLYFRLLWLALFRGGVGIYIQNGVIRDAVWNVSIPLDRIRSASREATKGFFRSTLVIEAGGVPPANRAYPELNPGKTLRASAWLYDTSLEVMLERLEACGVKIKGSKTAVLGL